MPISIDLIDAALKEVDFLRWIDKNNWLYDENVVKNAVEAQPKGGYCHIHIKPQGDRITVVIQSGGFTLTKEESDNIFEPYFTTKTQGTGLGLAISRKIVEAHGGTITATPDTLERTLTLVIALPVRQSGPNRVTPSTPTGGIPA